MSSIVISGDTSGTITLAAPAIAGSNTLTLPLATDTLAGIAATQTLTNKTLTAPVLSGSLTGTYTLAGTPTISSPSISSPSISSAVMTTMASSVITSATAKSTATCSFTGVIAGTALTASAITGTITVGQLITGTGVTAGTTIISGSGTAWVVSVSQTVSSTAITVVGIDFTSIPSWVKRITVMFAGISYNATATPMIQLGTSGGIDSTSNYVGSSINSITGTTTESALNTVGFNITPSSSAAQVFNLTVTLSLLNASTNQWICNVSGGRSDSAGGYVGGGNKTLSATLDRVRITTLVGTATFDAGSINILYE